MCRIKNNRLALEALPQVSTHQRLFFSVLHKMALPGINDGVNLYSYAKQAPSKLIDTNGLQAVTPRDAGVPPIAGVPLPEDIPEEDEDIPEEEIEIETSEQSFADRPRVLFIAFTGGISGSGARVSHRDGLTGEMVDEVERYSRAWGIQTTSIRITPGSDDDSSIETALREVGDAEYDQIIVYGYSNGGGVAVEFAERFERRIDLLITVDSAYSVFDTLPYIGVDHSIPSNVAINLNIFQRYRGWSDAPTLGRLDLPRATQSSDTSGNWLGSAGAPNIADDPDSTVVFNVDFTGAGVSHHNIDDLTQDSVIHIIDTFIDISRISRLRAPVRSPTPSP